MKYHLVIAILAFLLGQIQCRSNFRTYSPEHLQNLKDRVSQMFHYAYDGYLKHAYPYDEVSFC